MSNLENKSNFLRLLREQKFLISFFPLQRVRSPTLFSLFKLIYAKKRTNIKTFFHNPICCSMSLVVSKYIMTYVKKCYWNMKMGSEKETN